MKFWCCWEAWEEAKDGRCNMELVTGSGEVDKIQFRVALLEQELGGLRYIGQIRLGGSFANPCILTVCLVDQLLFGGRRRGFMPWTSVSSSITHRYVVFVFTSFFPTLLAFILFLCYIEYGLEQFIFSSIRFYSISHLV